mmetsp:Transcript_12917/g.40584  ORF Transcript_12917/g.40584 Transcript_12917/m.40584 type:complete len:222 (+) Transcript_12917:295-960(+)
MKIGADHEAMLEIAHAEPHPDRLGRKAAVALREDETAARLEHAAHLLEDLKRLGQVVHRDDTRDDVERPVVKWKFGLHIQVSRLEIGELRVGGKLARVHARGRDARHALGKVVWVVRHPARADVQDRRAVGDRRLVIVGERAHGALVNVVDEARRVVEIRIVRLVRARERGRRERVVGRPRLREDFGGDVVLLKFHSHVRLGDAAVWVGAGGRRAKRRCDH